MSKSNTLTAAEIAANLMDYEASSNKAFLDSFTDLPSTVASVVDGAALSMCHHFKNADNVLSGYFNSIGGVSDFGERSEAEYPAYTVGYVSINRPSQIVALEERTEEVWESDKFLKLEFFKVHPSAQFLGKSVEFSEPLAKISVEQALVSHVLCYEEVFSILLYLGIGAATHLTDSGYILTHVKIKKDPFHFKHISPELKAEALEEEEELQDQTGVLTLGLTNPHAQFPFIALTWDEAVLIRDHQAWKVYDESPQAEIDAEEAKGTRKVESFSLARTEYQPTLITTGADLLQGLGEAGPLFLSLFFPDRDLSQVKKGDVDFTVQFNDGMGALHLEWEHDGQTETRDGLLAMNDNPHFYLVDVSTLTTDQVELRLRDLAKAGAEYTTLAKIFKISVTQVMVILMK